MGDQAGESGLVVKSVEVMCGYCPMHVQCSVSGSEVLRETGYFIKQREVLSPTVCEWSRELDPVCLLQMFYPRTEYAS